MHPGGQAPASTHEAFWPEDLFRQGIGWIIVARFKSGGRHVLSGVFLVDVFCLGVKMASYEKCEAQDYVQRICGIMFTWWISACSKTAAEKPGGTKRRLGQSRVRCVCVHARYGGGFGVDFLEGVGCGNADIRTCVLEQRDQRGDR